MGCLIPIILNLVLFLAIVVITLSMFHSVVSLFAAEKEAKAMDPAAAFPAEFFYLYREAEQEFFLPWALLAAIHYIQTDYASSGGLLNGYSDAFNLPDNIWYTYMTSRDEYFRQKNGGTEDPYYPNRSYVGDIVFTVATYMEDVNYMDDAELTEKLNGITNDSKKSEDIKFYFWLFSRLYGRPGWPLPDEYGVEYITSEFGSREDPFGGGSTEDHSGVDIAAPEGEAIYAFADGEVVSVSEDAGDYGTLIIIEHPLYTRKDGEVKTIRTYYAHSQRLFVKEGQKVVGGQKIAEVGMIGRATGYHLHFEVRIKPSIFSGWQPVDPMLYLIPPEEVMNT